MPLWCCFVVQAATSMIFSARISILGKKNALPCQWQPHEFLNVVWRFIWTYCRYLNLSAMLSKETIFSRQVKSNRVWCHKVRRWTPWSCSCEKNTKHEVSWWLLTMKLHNESSNGQTHRYHTGRYEERRLFKGNNSMKPRLLITCHWMRWFIFCERQVSHYVGFALDLHKDKHIPKQYYLQANTSRTANVVATISLPWLRF